MSAVEVLFIDVLDRLANASLNLDPQSTSRLKRLDGHMVRLEGEMSKNVSPRIFTLKVESGHLSFYPHALSEPNVIVKGKLADLGAWLLSRGASANVAIVGDETVLQELQAVFRDFEPDLGKPLSNLIGSQVAEDLLGTVELAFAALRSAVEGAGSAIKHSAAGRYADEARLNALLDGIDNVRMRTDRVAARIRAEESRRQPLS
ncbi:MAG: hypothetical protein O7F71_02960 [Gammaproteobacteria bacterium]|nr:hypothetical protein [Gammaproteobacteria bacterium]